MSLQEENKFLITKIKDYIHQNVKEKLSLDILAKKANYSSFHFQRLFKSEVGETPKQYIKRIRLENAIHFIKLKPSASILEVAFEFGFSSLESFSRAFKNYYDISPNGFRKSTEPEQIKIIQNKTDQSLDAKLFLPKANTNVLVVEIVKLPVQNFVYIPKTLTSPEDISDGFKQIKQWSEARDLIGIDSTLTGILLDFPLFTSLSKCRVYTAMSVDKEPALSGEIQFLKMPSRKYASFKAKGGITSLVKEVTKLSNNWLPQSSYEIAHLPAILKPIDDPLSHHQHEIAYQVFIAINPK